MSPAPAPGTPIRRTRSGQHPRVPAAAAGAGAPRWV